MTDLASTLLAHAPLAGLFVLLLLGGIGLPVPEDATLIATGVLIAHETVPVAAAVPVVYAGVLVADLLLYHMGRKFGRAVLSRPRFQRIISPERLAALEDRSRRNGFLFVLVGRHVMGLRPQIFLAAGILRISRGTFLAADALSALGSVAVMVGIGYAGGNSLEVLRKDLTRIEHALIVIAAAAAAAILVTRYVRSRRARESERGERTSG